MVSKVLTTFSASPDHYHIEIFSDDLSAHIAGHAPHPTVDIIHVYQLLWVSGGEYAQTGPLVPR